ncbi:MAG: tyrosine-type recombinase/integrase [Ginsengibacter sp.]
MPFSETPPIQDFLDHLTFQKRYSKHTILSYQNDLTAFFKYISTQYGDISPDKVTASIVRTWLASLKQYELSSRSINRKISALKSFFKYQLRSQKIRFSPMTAIVSLKISKRLPSFIEQKELETLFRHVEFPATWEGKTNRLLLSIFYQSGIRLTELINLKVSQVDKSNRTIKVLGKGNKERLIPVNKELMEELLQYISSKKDELENFDGQYILVNGKGKKLYPKYVYTVVKRYLGEVTTNERKSPHILRHSFATHLTNNGADINAVKELLGHSSLAATQIYTHNTIEKLKEIHKRAHPKS